MDRVEVDGLHVAFERVGKGPTAVVLLHGYVGDRPATWRDQLDALADAYTVVAWDAPGAGSTAGGRTPPCRDRRLDAESAAGRRARLLPRSPTAVQRHGTHLARRTEVSGRITEADRGRGETGYPDGMTGRVAHTAFCAPPTVSGPPQAGSMPFMYRPGLGKGLVAI